MFTVKYILSVTPEIFVFHSNYASTYYRFRDIAAYLSKIATPLCFAPPLGVKPADFSNDPWRRKTRRMGLSDGERISMICSAVLTQSTRVTDGRTDRQTELAWHRPIRAMAFFVRTAYKACKFQVVLMGNNKGCVKQFPLFHYNNYTR